MKKEFYTVSEFANICGISKQAVYKRLNNSLKEFLKVENGQKLISAAALSIFEGQVVEQQVKQQVNEVEQQGLISFLQKQIEEKDKQIEAFQNQVNSLNNLISSLTLELTEITKQSQELNRNNQILLLNQKDIKQLQSNNKKNIFNKLFKRKEREEENNG